MDDQAFNLMNEGGQKLDLWNDPHGYNEKMRSIRPEARKNPDGTESTHLMTYGEVDGKFYAWPTLFPGLGPVESGQWIEPGAEEGADKWSTFDMAKERDELFEFDTEEEAARFAEGSWKE